MATRLTIAEAMRALRAAEPPGAAPHPGSEEMLAYHEGRLARDEADALEGHLVRCRHCTERSIELARFLAPPERSEQQGEGRVRRRFRPPHPLQGLAALLLATTIVSALAWLSTRRELLRLENGEVNVPIVEIDAGLGRQAGPAGSPPPREVPPRAVLVFTPPTEAGGREYTVRISNAGGGLVWSGPGLRPTANGSFQFRLPRGLQPGQTYRIVIVPGDPQGFSIRVSPPAPG